MPGRLFLTRPMAELAQFLGCDALEDPPRDDIAPGEEILVYTGDGLTRMRWGLIPVGRVNARGRPVMETIINARGETVFQKSAYAGTGRALIPCDGWYEWTGKKGRKQRWRIWPTDGQPLLFAAITDTWTAPGGREIPQVAAVTTEPSDDVKKLHDRMGVIVPLQDARVWLQGHPAQAEALIRPAPKGTLIHAQAAGAGAGR